MPNPIVTDYAFPTREGYVNGVLTEGVFLGDVHAFPIAPPDGYEHADYVVYGTLGVSRSNAVGLSLDGVTYVGGIVGLHLTPFSGVRTVYAKALGPGLHPSIECSPAGFTAITGPAVVSGVVSGDAAVAGDVAVVAPVSGAVDVPAQVSGDASVVGAAPGVAGEVNAASDVQGSAHVVAPVAGGVDNAADVTGNATAVAGGATNRYLRANGTTASTAGGGVAASVDSSEGPSGGFALYAIVGSTPTTIASYHAENAPTGSVTVPIACNGSTLRLQLDGIVIKDFDLGSVFTGAHNATFILGGSIYWDDENLVLVGDITFSEASVLEA